SQLLIRGAGGTVALHFSHLTAAVNFSSGTTCLRPHFGHHLVSISSFVLTIVSAIIHAKGFIALPSFPRAQPQRTTSTAQGAPVTSAAATPPRPDLSSGRSSPFEPTKMVSADHSAASSTSTRRGSPSLTSTDTLRPFESSTTRAPSAISRAFTGGPSLQAVPNSDRFGVTSANLTG